LVILSIPVWQTFLEISLTPPKLGDSSSPPPFFPFRPPPPCRQVVGFQSPPQAVSAPVLPAITFGFPPLLLVPNNFLAFSAPLVPTEVRSRNWTHCTSWSPTAFQSGNWRDQFSWATIMNFARFFKTNLNYLLPS